MTRARRYVRTLAMLLTVTFLTTAVYAVDGVVLIDQNRALAGSVTPGDAPGYPIQITKGGSYRLSGDLSVADLTTTGFSLETNQPVTIDFNGFTLSGPNAGQTQPCQAVSPGKGVGTEYVEQDYTLVTIPKAGHFVQADAAELVTKTIRGWLLR